MLMAYIGRINDKRVAYANLICYSRFVGDEVPQSELLNVTVVKSIRRSLRKREPAHALATEGTPAKPSTLATK